jgi:beta-lactamase regulating signal transducer with metallopeptidase domain/biopolymer transport protein ExbD
MNLLSGSWMQYATQWASDGAHWLWVWSWRALALLACIWVIQQIWRGKAPALRHQVWLCGLIAVAVMPLCALLLQWFPLLPPESPAFNILTITPPLVIEPLTADPPQPEGSASLVNTIVPALFAVWLIGALLKLAQSVKSHLKLRRLVACAQHLPPAEVRDFMMEDPLVRLTPEIHTPILCGVFRPIILLPADIAEWTTPAERLSMIRHELAHIERRDPIVNLFQTALQIVFLFHPLVRYACRQLNLERELACDDRVVGMGTVAEVYAAGILKVVERSVTSGGVHQLALFSTKQVLERRIDLILDTNRVRVFKTKWRHLVLPIALLALISLLVLPLSPADASLMTVIQDGQALNQQQPSPISKSDPWFIGVNIPGDGSGYKLNNEDIPSLDDLSRRLNKLLDGRPADKKLVYVSTPGNIANEELVKVVEAIKAAGGVPILPQGSPWDIIVKVNQDGGEYTINDKEEFKYATLDDLSRGLKGILDPRPSDRKMVVISAPETLVQKEKFKLINAIRLAGGIPILLQSPWDLVVAISEGGQRYNLNAEDYSSLGDLRQRLKEILDARPSDKKSVTVVTPDSLPNGEVVKVFNVIKAAGGKPIRSIPPPPPPPPPPPKPPSPPPPPPPPRNEI